MPRVLLLVPSTSYRAADFLAAAASLGVEVVVGSDHRQVLGRLAPGRSLHVNLRDPRRAARAIAAHARSAPVDAVIGTDDASVAAAAAAARRLGLAHNAPAAVAAARDKLRFREAMRAAGVPGPRFKPLALDAAARVEPLAFPCVVKPRHLSASRGVLRVDDAQELDAACGRIRRLLAAVPVASDPELRRTVLLEDYVPGSEVALEGLLDDGRLEVLALFDKPDPMHGPTFAETLLVTPSRLARGVQRDVAQTVQRAAAALGLRHGPVHAEARVNAGGVWMIELAPRTIGGLCSRALRFADGDSLEARVIRNALGTARGGTPSRHALTGASGVLMIPVARDGRLQAVDGVDAARRVAGIDGIVISAALGERVVALPEDGRYLGFVFARGSSPLAVERSLRAANDALAIRIEP